MPQLVSQEEFDRLLDETPPDLAPYPVFVQPKKTDRGYFTRRETLMRWQTAQAKFATAYQDIQRETGKLDKQSAAVRESLDNVKAARDAAEEGADTTDLDRQIANLQDDLDRIQDESAPLLAKMMGLVGQLDEAVEGQVEIILPYIKAIKYPQPDGSSSFWVRPSAGDDLAQFETDARALLKDISEEDFTTMTNAITGTADGARSVPTRNGSR